MHTGAHTVNSDSAVTVTRGNVMAFKETRIGAKRSSLQPLSVLETDERGYNAEAIRQL